MADNLIQKSHKTSEKNKFNNVVHRTTSESLRLNESEKGVTHPTSLQAAHNPRKISSFQITSVTVGSRVSTDAGEDSADDLDESHTDDISRITDIENETPSYSEDTFSKDDVFYNASSASLACAPVIPTSSQYGLAIVGQDGAAPAGAVPNSNSQEVTDMHVSVTNAGTGSIINLIGNAKPQEGMKEIQEHVRNERFKVVKIESTEPFRRGRWVCMDYLDHTSTQQNAPITLNNNLDMTESNTLQAPDSGVVMNDCQHEETPNDLINKGPKDVQGNAPTMQQLEQTLQKQFPIASPGQSLTQPLNSVQQHMPVNQSVSVQSPPLEMPQQMGNQNMAGSQQVAQQHPQSMTHITLQGAAPSHAAPGHAAPGHAAAPPSHAPAGPLHVPQSFPQHHLQQVIAAHQALQQQMPMHQQMQQMPNQQMQQMGQHMQQPQMTNMQQMQPMPQMQAMPAQGQMQQVPNQQPQMQQMQMQQMQGQNPQQMNMQQAQMPSMGAGHHMQGQQAMQGQQPQLQQLSNQAQMQAMQGQQMPNHMQQMQMPTNQQMPQMQPQMHQMPAQAQQQVVGGMHPQMQQQSMPGVQQQYNTVSQSNQAMLGAGMPAAPPQLVAQYHAPPAQGQTLPQEVLSGIVTSQQGATLPGSLQPLVSQPQGSTLPASLQMAGAPQQAGMQMMSAPQNMQMTLDGNQPNMQMPASEQMYMQSGAVGHMLPQPVGAQYVPGQAVPQMAHQSMPMAMQAPSMPVMSGAVHPAVVQSQSSMGLGYGGVAAVMSQSSVAPAEVVSGTNSPVVSLPAPYAGAPLDAQGFGSPVSAVSASVVNASDSAPSDAPPEPPPDAADGKEDQAAPPAEDESASGTSAVAIDNKIEQAMDLVKSHLMFAVREEVEVLKERIAELMERINQLEVENSFLRAHAASDTLAALPGARAAPGPAPPAS